MKAGSVISNHVCHLTFCGYRRAIDILPKNLQSEISVKEANVSRLNSSIF